MDEEVQNRHRYKKHAQQISEIDIHIANRIQEIRLIPDSYEEDLIGIKIILGSFFFDELESQRIGNFTPEYTNFYISIIDESQNLALILNNLDKIVDSILQYLPTHSTEMLDLLKNLCRDCRGEIYTIFCEKLFVKLVELI